MSQTYRWLEKEYTELATLPCWCQVRACRKCMRKRNESNTLAHSQNLFRSL